MYKLINILLILTFSFVGIPQTQKDISVGSVDYYINIESKDWYRTVIYDSKAFKTECEFLEYVIVDLQNYYLENCKVEKSKPDERLRKL